MTFPSPFSFPSPSPFFASTEDLFPALRLLDLHHPVHHHQPSFRITRRWAQPLPQFLKVLDGAVAPRFDVREGTAAFELQGEVPGLRHEDVVIEFVDSRTLVIRGKRGETEETETEPDTKSKGGVTQQSDVDDGNKKTQGQGQEGATNARAATVEDAEDAEDVQNTTTTTAADEDAKSTTTTTTTSTATIGGGANTPTSSSSSSSPAENIAQTPASAQPQSTNPNTTSDSKSQSKSQSKFWLNERILIQQFERRFKFPAHVDVDHEAVKASLRNGILTVVVPKVVKEEGKEGTRRILVE